jgi:hypothetical protein
MKTTRLLPDGQVVTVLSDGTTVPLKTQTDWAKLKAMTEEEIEANALSDTDNPPLTDKELKRFEPITTMNPLIVKSTACP